ncbi:MAG: Calx-beta domain-containing protein [Planctomycetaceae bacterium]
MLRQPFFKAFLRSFFSTKTRRTGTTQSPVHVEVCETRVLLSGSPAEVHLDFDHGFDQFGNEWHSLPEATLDASTIGGGEYPSGTAPFAYSETFLLHSNAGAAHTIYLDFNGHTTSGTTWNTSFNGGNDFTTPAYNTDGIAGFSNGELESIQKVWQRVVEDFAPFDVDVTTEEPANIGDLIKSGTGDTAWGVRVVIGGSSYDWYGNGAGGVAYVGSFNWNTDTPTYVFPDQLGNGFQKYVAEAVSHEAGHTLGLRHDGTSTQGYYTGQGSGETGWAPIMGVGYYQNLTQWSKGEYADANRTEDDLAIITSQNGFGYRADDAGNTNGTANAANTFDATTIDGAGLIERSTDVDVYSFATGAGTISIDVQEFEIGPNLDILAEIYDGSGTLIASANPTDRLDAQLSASVAAGTYFLHISGTGKGDPAGTGYSDYGSLGQYSFTGTVVATSSLPSLSVTSANVTEGGTLSFVVTLSAASNVPVSFDYSTADGTASAGFDYLAASGTVVIPAGMTSAIVNVSTTQDSDFEADETLTLSLTGSSGAIIGAPNATGTIVNDDQAPLPTISISDASIAEGKLNTKGKNAGTPQYTNMSFIVTLSAPSNVPVTADFATLDGTATVADSDYIAAAGTITFAPGTTSQTVSVTIVGDNTQESDETFSVLLSNASNASIGDGSGTGSILDDDTGGGGGGGKGGGNGGGKGKPGAVVESAYVGWNPNSSKNNEDFLLS